MTFSIIARCPRTGRFGVGSTTFSMACGRRNESVRPNVGHQQVAGLLPAPRRSARAQHARARLHAAAHRARARSRRPGLRLSPVRHHRPRRATSSRTPGTASSQWAGHIVGPYYATYGNGLAGPQTVEGIVRGSSRHPTRRSSTGCWWRSRAAATPAARCRRDARPERSAWIRVVDALDHPEIDVRVDLHDRTVAELRRVLEEFKRRREYYEGRCAHPGDAVPEEQFEATLSRA